jgi:antitoxin PrlF
MLVPARLASARGRPGRDAFAFLIQQCECITFGLQPEGNMIESVITAKSQTTLPSGVRKALGVGPGDRLAYIVEGDRAVIMKASLTDAHEDPVVEAFLAFLERDMAAHPERPAGLAAELVERARALTDGIEVDLDEPIEGDVAI